MRAFTPDVVRDELSSLVELLGPTYVSIMDRDRMGQSTRPPNPQRHLLAVLVENADHFAADFAKGIRPSGLADYLAFRSVVSVLTRARSDPVFPELISQLETHEGFRHHMVMLGMWDHVSRHATDNRVRLLSDRVSGRRRVDLILGDESNPRFQVEVKTPKEFDGPQAMVTPAKANEAIEREWRRAYHGPDSQIPQDKPSILLIGGLTLRLESLPVVQVAAEKWLKHRGQSKPNLWGVVALTYFSHITLPLGRSMEDGAPIDVDGRGGVHLAIAENPHYTGSPKIYLLPGFFEDEGPSSSRPTLY